VLVFAALFTIAGTAHRPAQAALMPQLARSPAELAAANVAWSAIDYAGFLLGSAAAGVLAGIAGPGAGFAACAGAMALAVLAAATLPRDVRPPAPEQGPGGFAEVTEGLRTVAAHPEMRLLAGIYTIDAFVQGVTDVLLVVAALELFGLGEQGAGWLNVAWGIGGVAAGVAALALLGRGRLAAGLTGGLALAGVSLALAGLLASPGAAFPLLVLMGVGFALVECALLTLTQRLAPDDVLGRVFGVEEAAEVLALALGSVVAAALVGAIGIQGALIATGAVLPVVALVTASRLAGTAAGARVPERAYGLVRRLSLFSPLPVATLENLALRLEERHFAPGETIVRQGDVGDAFYVIAGGEVEVEIDGVFRRREGEGDFFGEIALLRDVPRTATITAGDAVTALEIDREAFLAAIGAHNRSSGAAESAATDRLAADAAALS
jgi:hypothetical protein